MLIRKLKEKHDAMANTKLPPEEVAKLLKKGAFLLDVRSRLEAKIGMAPGATNISLLRLKSRMDELPRDRTLVAYCGTGGRACKAVEILEANGFKAVNGGGYKAILKILASKQEN